MAKTIDVINKINESRRALDHLINTQKALENDLRSFKGGENLIAWVEKVRKNLEVMKNNYLPKIASEMEKIHKKAEEQRRAYEQQMKKLQKI
jgi:vacuolar-type H+-ATPase subunit I/STV1